MRRPTWKCPECVHRSTRKGNMLRHIERIHPNSKKKPVQEERGAIANKMNYCWSCGARL